MKYIETLEKKGFLKKKGESIIYQHKYIRIRNSIIAAIRDAFSDIDEIEMPVLLDDKLIRNSPVFPLLDRVRQYKVYFGGKLEFWLAQSHEEFFASMLGDKDWVVFQIAKKYRPEYSDDETKLKEFYMMDLYFAAIDEKDFERVYDDLCKRVLVLAEKLGVRANLTKGFTDSFFRSFSQEFRSADLEIGHIFKFKDLYKNYYPKSRINYMGALGIGIDRLAILRCMQ